MTMSNILNFLNKFCAYLNKAGLVIAGIGLTLMMFLTGVDVTIRFIPNRPIPGSMELTEFLLSLTVGFGLAYCALRKGHIRVDLILMYVSPKVQRILDIVAYIVSFGFYSLVVWQTFNSGLSLMQTKITSSVLLIPVFPFIFLFMIATTILAIVFLKDVFEYIAEMRQK